jgi:hypothetical protein
MDQSNYLSLKATVLSEYFLVKDMTKRIMLGLLYDALHWTPEAYLNPQAMRALTQALELTKLAEVSKDTLLEMEHILLSGGFNSLPGRNQSNEQSTYKETV